LITLIGDLAVHKQLFEKSKYLGIQCGALHCEPLVDNTGLDIAPHHRDGSPDIGIKAMKWP